MDTIERDAILIALGKWVRQRPGLEFGNYGDARSYSAEMRGIARDRRDAETLLRAVQWSSISAEALREAFRAFSGRLSWDGARLSYCTGQYWPTESRTAACAVLASALWRHRAADLSPDESADKLRSRFRREFGRGLAGRWFN